MAWVKIWAQSVYYFTNDSYLSETSVAKFQKNGKIWISCVDKGFAFWWENILFKQTMAW